jgi:excinuclease ABC subunit B
MERAISETNRRRTIQDAFNKKHGITPISIKKDIRDTIDTTVALVGEAVMDTADDVEAFDAYLSDMTRQALIKKEKDVEKAMREAAKQLNFEQAAILRDQLILIRGKLNH